MKLKIDLPDVSKLMRERGLMPGGEVSRAVGEQVLMLSREYIPMESGRLIESGKADGKSVTWSTPYAQAQYFGKDGGGRKAKGLRGPHWFDRMKADRMGEILKRAADMAGGKVK